ncbi:MAG: polysaccharide deacetylase family protein, partial [Helicobacter sp.]|nr:polysaccharide deacetylase family protein [Helicobacter sp.]
MPVYCVEREEKIVALSFDAAWGNEDTQTLIDILNKYGINTTFFVVGDWVDKFPESVKALHDAGNEIMNHSSDHAHFSRLSEDEIVA